jgi:hypothetical protein
METPARLATSSIVGFEGRLVICEFFGLKALAEALSRIGEI